MFKAGIEYDRGRGVYRVRKIVNGKIHKGTFPTKRSAIVFIEKIVLDGRGIHVAELVPTVREAVDSYLRNCELAGRSESTFHYYSLRRKPLEESFGDERLDRLRQGHIDAHIEARKKVVGGNTISKELSFLLTVYRHVGIAPGWRLTALTVRPSRKRVHPVEQIRAVILEASEPVFCAVGLCLFAGMRAAEAWRADASWVRGEHIAVEMLKAGGEVNVTYLVEPLRDRLPKSGPLVTASEWQVGYELEKLSKKHGISPALRGPGIFRHHCATYAAELGFTREDRKLVLGHRFGDVTDRYVHSQEIGRKKKVLEAVAGYVFGTAPVTPRPE